LSPKEVCGGSDQTSGVKIQMRLQRNTSPLILEMRGYTLPHLISEIIWCFLLPRTSPMPDKKIGQFAGQGPKIKTKTQRRGRPKVIAHKNPEARQQNGHAEYVGISFRLGFGWPFECCLNQVRSHWDTRVMRCQNNL